ncbi:hypothetical protein V6N13_106841 [Hibiscus sabdariffa]
MVIFLKPRISGRKVDAIIASLGFPYSHHVEATGFSGGIWIAWFHSIKVDIEYNHFQFVHCRITTVRDNSSALATIIYGSPNATNPKALWSNLRSDSMGGSLSSKPSKCFHSLVYDFGLRDIGFHGPEFTWQRGSTQVRLDRTILLTVGNTRHGSTHSYFRYFLGWSLHDDFGCMVSDNWVPSSSLSGTIISFTKAVGTLNKTTYGYIGTKKRMVMASLRGTQKALCSKPSHFLLNHGAELLVELENILNQEELLWWQKSRTD